MKNLKLILSGTILFLTVTAINATELKSEVNDVAINYRIEEITQRVEEIRSMDKSEMTKMERKDLKNELVSLKKEAREMGLDNRISISVGALIIIILVLIIIL